VEQYARERYGAVSLADAVRKLLPGAAVQTVTGTSVLPAQTTDIPAAVAAAKEADAIILYIGGKGGWYGDDLKRAAILPTSTCRRGRSISSMP
jgi:beta-xylosidase